MHINLDFSSGNFRKKQDLLGSSGITDWQIYLVAVMRVMKGYLSLNLCPMTHLQSTYSIVSSLDMQQLVTMHLL